MKQNRSGVFKLLGIPIYEYSSDYNTNKRKQSFLFGLIKTYKIQDEFSYHTEKYIKIFGITITRRVEDGNNFIWYIAGIPIKKIKLEDIYRKHYLKGIKEDYDDVYILDANSGEIYLFLTYIADNFLKKNGSKKPLFIATTKYHTDLINTICPQIAHIFVPKHRKNIKSNCFTSKSTRFYMIFQHSHFKEIDHLLHSEKDKDIHYFKSIIERLNINENEIKMKPILITKEYENSMIKKVEEIGLNIDNFIFIAPEAQSCKELDNDFWQKLINRVTNKGYDVFLNIVSDNSNIETGTFKTCFLSYPEAFALARRAKKIISLRSGLTEYLLQTDVPMDILYTEFRKRHLFDDLTTNDVQRGFTTKRLPHINNTIIREFNTDEYTYEDLLPLLV